MPFCYAPWTNLDIDPQGNLAPCCKYRHDRPALNIQNSSISEYQNSAAVHEIKEIFKQGQWPRGCDRCRIEEENNISSKRQLDYDRWQQQYQDYDIDAPRGFLTASVAFGNTCNLSCVTCNPWVSSRWQKEWAIKHGKDIAPNHFYKDNLIDDLVQAAPNLIHLDVPGGEPFLSGVQQQKELLQYYCDTGQSQNIALHYTTNTTQWPDDDWWDLWENFREVEIQLSLDGVGQRLEYIRYPAKWDIVKDVTEKYVHRQKQLSNLRLSVSCTVSAYNVYYLDELTSWCYTMELPVPWFGRVHNPDYMRPTIWPDAARDFIIDKLRNSQHKELHTWATMLSRVNDNDRFDTFKEHVRWQDQYRRTDFDSTFPEIARYL